MVWLWLSALLLLTVAGALLRKRQQFLRRQSNIRDAEIRHSHSHSHSHGHSPVHEMPAVVETAPEVEGDQPPPAEVTAELVALIPSACKPNVVVTFELPITCAEFEALFLSAEAVYPLATFQVEVRACVDMQCSAWAPQADTGRRTRSLTFRRKIPTIGFLKQWVTIKQVRSGSTHTHRRSPHTP